MRIHTVLATILSLGSPTLLGAQSSAFGTLDGTIRERIATRSVRSVTVSLVQMTSDATATRSKQPDGQGRFRVDSLLPGRYLMQISTPTLDSLDLVPDSLAPESLDPDS